MAYKGQVVEGYKAGALMDSNPYNTAQTFYFGSAAIFNTTTGVLDLAKDESNVNIRFCVDGTDETGSDCVAVGKIPNIMSGAIVASSLIDDGAGGLHTPVAADIGKVVTCAFAAGAPVAGRWQLTDFATLTPGDIYVGTVQAIETFHDVVMAVFEFNPRQNVL